MNRLATSSQICALVLATLVRAGPSLGVPTVPAEANQGQTAYVLLCPPGGWLCIPVTGDLPHI